MNARSLTDALDRLAPPQQFVHDWSDVLSRAGVETAHRSGPGRRKRKWLLAAAIVAAVVVPVAAATVAARSDWWFFSSHGPQPLTEPVVVKTGVWDGKNFPVFSAKYSRMALLSKTITSPSTMAGTLPLGLMERAAQRTNLGFIREDLSITISVDVFMKITNARKAKIALGANSFTLTDCHLDALRNFASTL